MQCSQNHHFFHSYIRKRNCQMLSQLSEQRSTESLWLCPSSPETEPTLFWPVYYILTWKILLDQLWQCWPCRTALIHRCFYCGSSCANSCIALSTVTSWNSTHTHKSPCGLGKSETWRDELMSHHTQQWIEQSRAVSLDKGSPFPPGYGPFVLLDFILGLHPRTSYLLVTYKLLSLQP